MRPPVSHAAHAALALRRLRIRPLSAAAATTTTTTTTTNTNIIDTNKSENIENVKNAGNFDPNRNSQREPPLDPAQGRRARLHSPLARFHPHVGIVASFERFRAPRHPVVLCHGLFGFDVIGPESIPFLRLRYWRGICDALASIGCDVRIPRVGSVAALSTRAQQLHAFLDQNLSGRSVNLVGHSMGGLDGRYLISHIPSTSYRIASITTVATPHRGSSFMDWCRDTLGVGQINLRTPTKSRSRQDCESASEDVAIRAIVSSLPSAQQPVDRSDTSRNSPSAIHPRSPKSRTPNTTSRGNPLLRAICAPLDAPAFTSLTRDYCLAFNQVTPDNPHIFYGSYAASTNVSTFSPLHFSYQIIRRAEGANDGLVSLESAKWGEFMGTVNCDHWELVPPKIRSIASSIYRRRFDSIDFYLRLVTEVADRGL